MGIKQYPGLVGEPLAGAFEPLPFIEKIMKLNKVSADIGETELERIVIDAVTAQTGLKVASVSFKIGHRSSGYGMSETSTPYFEGATVTFEKDQLIVKGVE